MRLFSFLGITPPDEVAITENAKNWASVITGIPKCVDSEVYQSWWELQKTIDENDWGSEEPDFDDPEDEDEPRPWWQVW